MLANILGTDCDQFVCMVQCCFTSTETIRLIRTGSRGQPPWFSHSSWTLPCCFLSNRAFKYSGARGGQRLLAGTPTARSPPLVCPVCPGHWNVWFRIRGSTISSQSISRFQGHHFEWTIPQVVSGFFVCLFVCFSFFLFLFYIFYCWPFFFSSVFYYYFFLSSLSVFCWKFCSLVFEV